MAPSNHASSSSLSPSSSSSSSSSVGADNVTISHAPIEGHLPQRQRRGAEQGGSSVGFFEASSSSSHTDDARDEARQAIVSSLVQILEQPLGMLRDGTIGDAQMAAESRLIPGSSLGKHLRQCVRGDRDASVARASTLATADRAPALFSPSVFTTTTASCLTVSKRTPSSPRPLHSRSRSTTTSA